MDTKCLFCKRKTHLIVKCRCEGAFCIAHRDPDDHKCGFDFKEHGKEEIQKNNPKIKSQKVELLL